MAFEHISHIHRYNRLVKMREWFLTDPRNYKEQGVDWTRLLYPNNVIHVASPGPNIGSVPRDGSKEKPFRPGDINRLAKVAGELVGKPSPHLSPYQRIVYTGVFTGYSGAIAPQHDNVTIDLRGDPDVAGYVKGGSVVCPGNRHGHLGRFSGTEANPAPRPYELDTAKSDIPGGRYVYYIQETLFPLPVNSPTAGQLITSVDFTQPYWQVVVDGIPFRGHSGAQTPKGVITIIGEPAGTVPITAPVYWNSGQGLESDNSILIRTPWAYKANDEICIMGNRSIWPNGFAGLSHRTTYYVKWAGTYGRKTVSSGEAIRTATGYQRITISATLGGPTIEFTAAQVSGTAEAPGLEVRGPMPYPSNPGFYNTFITTPLAKHPLKDALQPEEFYADIVEGRLYFCTNYRLSEAFLEDGTTPTDSKLFSEVFVTSSPNSSGVSITLGKNVQVLGGKIVGAFRSVFFDTYASECGAWGTQVIGSYRGFCLQTSPIRTKTRFCEVFRSKYAFSSEEFSTGEKYTSHRFFIARDCATYLHNWGDRQALMLNPGSDYSEYKYGLVWGCGIDSFPANFAFPANQLDGINAQWGAMTNDAASNLKFDNVYFYNCYGTFFKNAISTTAPGTKDERLTIHDVDILNCIIDARGNNASTAHRAGAIFTLAQAGAVSGYYASGATNINIFNNLCLMAETSNLPLQWDGQKIASTLHTAVSRDQSPVEVYLRNNIVYGGGGAESTIFHNENRSGNTVSPIVAIDSDYNKYYTPTVTNMVVNVSMDSSKPIWAAAGQMVITPMYLESAVAMTNVAGPAPTWLSGPTVNETHSTVVTEDDMVAIGKKYTPWGTPLLDTVKQPWFQKPLV